MYQERIELYRRLEKEYNSNVLLKGSERGLFVFMLSKYPEGSYWRQIL